MQSCLKDGDLRRTIIIVTAAKSYYLQLKMAWVDRLGAFPQNLTFHFPDEYYCFLRLLDSMVS